MIKSLDDVLAPISPEQFFADFLGKKPLYISGAAAPKRFIDLMPWGDLNQILSSAGGRPNFRLFKDGKLVPENRFTRQHSSWVGSTQMLIDSVALAKEFSSGASIVVNRVEHMSPTVSYIARVLESAFRNYVDVVCFASWQSNHAFNTHWDREDVLICQVTGRKRWRLFENTRRHPTADDRKTMGTPPAGEPYWQGTLEPGDVLYIPNGWWHDALAQNGPTIHLSFGTELPTGIDLAQILIRKLTDREDFRALVPSFLSSERQEEYMRRFRRFFCEQLDGLSLADVFAERDEDAPVRGKVSLPWNAVPDHEIYSLPQTAWIHWMPSRPTPLREVGGKLKLGAGGSIYGFSPVARPVLDDLMSARSTSLQRLVERHPNVEPTAMYAFLMELVKSGLVSISE